MIVYGRMIEIYMMVSLAPVPMAHGATMSNLMWDRIIFVLCLRWDFRAF